MDDKELAAWLRNNPDLAHLNRDVSVDVTGVTTDTGPYMASRAEATFFRSWQALNGPELAREFQFHQVRRWRFDFCHTAAMVAIEIEGGTWQNGRHNRPQGFREDCEKYNTAALLGYVVIRLTPEMIQPHILQDIDDFIWTRRHQLEHLRDARLIP